VVQIGVEGPPIGPRPSAELNEVEHPVPGSVGLVADPCEAAMRDLHPQVSARVGHAHERDRDVDHDEGPARRVEGQVRPGAGPRGWPRGPANGGAGDRLAPEPISLPGSIRPERAAELSIEVHLVGRPFETEVAAGRRTGDLPPPWVDAHRGEAIRHRTAASVDQHRRRARSRIGKAAERRSRRRGHLHAHGVPPAGIESHLIEAGAGPLVRSDRRPRRTFGGGSYPSPAREHRAAALSSA
jgi:hypothetical protein